jgi:hypothetical protein
LEDEEDVDEDADEPSEEVLVELLELFSPSLLELGFPSRLPPPDGERWSVA